MQSRRQIIKAGLATSLASLSGIGVATSNSVHAAAPPSKFPYAVPMGEYPQPEFIRDALRLHFGSALEDKRNLFVGFDPQIVAHGMASEPIGKGELEAFYTAVFSAFPDFHLVDDSLLIAGNMGAHRYHAMGTFTGGPDATGEKIMFRGQTIYRVNESGRVDWRISNHDHDFREAQIAFSNPTGPEVAKRTWGPDPYARYDAYTAKLSNQRAWNQSEEYIRNCIAEMTAAKSSSNIAKYWSYYDDEAVIHGLDADNPLGSESKVALQQVYRSMYEAVPEIQFITDELIVCGPYAIQCWYASGHHKGAKYLGTAASGKLIHLREQTIYRFDENGKICERWINSDHAFIRNQLSS